MGVTMEARNATLADLATILKDQQAAKLDLVVPASAMRSVGGTVRIAGTSVWEQEGDGFVPTKVGDSQIADKLGIPPNYLRKLRESRIDLYDDNVNGWLHGFRTPEGIERHETLRGYLKTPPAPEGGSRRWLRGSRPRDGASSRSCGWFRCSRSTCSTTHSDLRGSGSPST